MGCIISPKLKVKCPRLGIVVIDLLFLLKKRDFFFQVQLLLPSSRFILFAVVF